MEKVFGAISLFEALDDAGPGLSSVSAFNANIGQFEALLNNANAAIGRYTYPESPSGAFPGKQECDYRD